MKKKNISSSPRPLGRWSRRMVTSLDETTRTNIKEKYIYIYIYRCSHFTHFDTNKKNHLFNVSNVDLFLAKCKFQYHHLYNLNIFM